MLFEGITKSGDCTVEASWGVVFHDVYELQHHSDFQFVDDV